MKKLTYLALIGIVIATSAIAAADEPEMIRTRNGQPYVIAMHSAETGTVAEVLPIISDAFLVATQTFPKSRVSREMYVASTGYNSEVAQTDDSPFIAADGTYVYDGMVAANFLPFGTKIKIPDYFGDKVFTVHDRMNKRYWERVDVWFPQKHQALQWGVRKVKIVILES